MANLPGSILNNTVLSKTVLGQTVLGEAGPDRGLMAIVRKVASRSVLFDLGLAQILGTVPGPGDAGRDYDRGRDL